MVSHKLPPFSYLFFKLAFTAQIRKANMPSLRDQGLLSPNNDVDFEETWQVISTSLKAMHEKTASNLSFETIYRHSYKIVLKKRGSDFYSKLMSFEKTWLSEHVHTQLSESIAISLLSNLQQGTPTGGPTERTAAGDRFMQALKDAFEDHQLVMNMATDVFMYLDRVYCNTERKPTIFTAGMMQFRDHVLRLTLPNSDLNMQQLLIRVLLEAISLERHGYFVDKALLKSSVHVLQGLHESHAETQEERLYVTCFEQQFLDASRAYYRELGARLINEADAAAYCQQTLSHIHKEKDRCKTMLSAETEAKIVGVLEDELIKNKLRELILTASGVKHMVDNDRYSELKLVYTLNSRVDPKKNEITMAIQRGVQEVGGQINEAAAQQAAGERQESTDAQSRPAGASAANSATLAAIQWVQAVLTLKEKYDKIWKDSLDSDQVIQPALSRSFTESINMLPRCTEFISLFIDENMKKGLKNKSEAEVDETLDKAIVLLRYVTDRDMFERYYKKHLCKRLLMNKSVSLDHEQEMVRKMKVELGNSFVAKMEAMFKDVAISESLSGEYRNHVAASSSGKRVDLAISVLTSMTWPIEGMQSANDSSQCILPPEIERAKAGFENFYGGKHSGRQLTWMANMGSADVRGHYPSGRKELNVSTYGMIILVLFNDLPAGASLTFDEIQSKTNIPSGDLKRNLQSLAVAAKTRLLVKEPMSKDVKPDDRFFFNEKFKSESSKIKVGVVAGGGNKVEGEQERKETERKNNDSRGYAIEAAIVRIMKYVLRFTLSEGHVLTRDSQTTQRVDAPTTDSRHIVGAVSAVQA